MSIEANTEPQPSAELQVDEPPASSKPQILVRYGVIPVVARCIVEQTGDEQTRDEQKAPTFRRGQQLVIKTSRGDELADFLQTLSAGEAKDDVSVSLTRIASDADLATHQKTRNRAGEQFAAWQQRISDWKLELELIDLEWTLDEEKTILYVLNNRGPDTTKLAIQATASGLGVVEVQPVDANGMVEAPPTGGGGCGSCSH